MDAGKGTEGANGRSSDGPFQSPGMMDGRDVPSPTSRRVTTTTTIPRWPAGDGCAGRSKAGRGPGCTGNAWVLRVCLCVLRACEEPSARVAQRYLWFVQRDGRALDDDNRQRERGGGAGG
jgi:hypothetical protein